MPIRYSDRVTHRHLSPTVAGALSGLLATAAQTAALQAVRLALPGPRGRFPPRQVTEAVVARLAGRRWPPAWSEPTWWVATAVSHAGFGTAAGAVYPAVPGRPGGLRRLVRGAAYGLAVYAVSYGLVLPAVGIRLPQGDRPVRKNLELIVAHLAWGLVTAAAYAYLSGSPTPPAGRPAGAGQPR